MDTICIEMHYLINLHLTLLKIIQVRNDGNVQIIITVAYLYWYLEIY